VMFDKLNIFCRLMTYFYCKKVKVSSAPVVSKVTFSRYSGNIKNKRRKNKNSTSQFYNTRLSSSFSG
jgi:hypothetical protein